jgi:hypothetical protein
MSAAVVWLATSIVLIATSSFASESEIAVFHFDEGKGAISAGSNGHKVTLRNVKWVEGRRGMGLRFEGNQSHVTVKHSDGMNLSEGPFTLQCWIEPEKYKTGTVYELMTKAHGGKGPGWRLFIAWGIIQFRTGEGSGEGKKFWGLSTTAKETEILSDQWNHIAVTRDEDQILRIYLNGQELAKSEEAFPVVSTKRHLSIGNYGAGYTYPFRGVLDEVAIYRKAKTAKEIFLEARAVD